MMSEYEKKTRENVLALIRKSLWGTGSCIVNQAIFDEMKLQTIVAIPTPIFNDIEMPDNVRNEWKKCIIANMLYYFKYKEIESKLPISIPYAILKGTSAAQYYPHAEYRTMGDIDIITYSKDFIVACNELLENGFSEVTVVEDLVHARHREFQKNGIKIEVHFSFVKLNNPTIEKKIDNLIIENISTSHKLPDMINGLVLIEHINQHLENGLGLRQVIDWMMFVDKCLPDEKWEEFRPLLEISGLEKLAIIITKMCELYLGLPKRQWTMSAEEAVCKELMDYIYDCGNFGNKKEEKSKIVPRLYAFSNNIFATFKVLQAKGIQNWNLIRRWPFLRYFAWIYQAVYYFRKILFRKNALREIRTEYVEGKDRTHLFEQLGVLQTSKRNIFFMDKPNVRKNRFKNEMP